MDFIDQPREFVNLAPYSYFNAVSVNTATVLVSSSEPKDSPS